MQHSFSSQPDRLAQQVLQTALTPYLKEAPLTTVLVPHRQRFSFSCSAHYFLLHYPSEHLLRAFCVMMEKKKKQGSKIMLSNFTLRSSCPKEAFDY